MLGPPGALVMIQNRFVKSFVIAWPTSTRFLPEGITDALYLENELPILSFVQNAQDIY